MTETIKAVIDVNVFISALLGSKNCLQIRELFLDGKYDMVISENIFNEFLKTVRHPKFSKYIHKEDTNTLLELLKTDGYWVFPKEKFFVCRDSKNNIIPECTVAGKANCIVTGDNDLLSLKYFKNIPILTPKQFIELLKSLK